VAEVDTAANVRRCARGVGHGGEGEAAADECRSNEREHVKVGTSISITVDEGPLPTRVLLRRCRYQRGVVEGCIL
jgi:hypothetical protein